MKLRRLTAAFSALLVLSSLSSCGLGRIRQELNEARNKDSSSYEADYSMPDLVGMNFQNALNLYGSNITLLAGGTEYNEAAKDTILDQSVSPGTKIVKGATVTVMLSDGKKNTEASTESSSENVPEADAEAKGKIKTKKTYKSKNALDTVILSVEESSEYLVRNEEFNKDGTPLRIEATNLVDTDYQATTSETWCMNDKTTYPRTFKLYEGSTVDIPADSWALYSKSFNYNDNGECTGETGYNSYDDVLFTRTYDLENHTAVMSHRASAVKSSDGKMYYYHIIEKYDDDWYLLSAELYDPFNTKLKDLSALTTSKTLCFPDGDSISISDNEVEYDEKGNVIKYYDDWLNIDYFGFEYDDHNNVTRRYFHLEEPKSGESIGTIRQYYYTYDDNGRLIQVSYDEYDDNKEHVKRKHIISYTYNESGKVKTKKATGADYHISVKENDYGKYMDGSCGTESITEYEYTQYGNLKKETYSSQKFHGDITYDLEDQGYTRYEYTYY